MVSEFPYYPLLDPTDLSSWLADIGREFRQYGFNLFQAGVDRKFLPHLTDTHLKTDCQVKKIRGGFFSWYPITRTKNPNPGIKLPPNIIMLGLKSRGKNCRIRIFQNSEP